MRRLVFTSLVATSLILSGCGEEAVAPPPDLAISDSQRSICPESPFRPEFPMAPKVAAYQGLANAVDYDIKIYTSRGKFIQAMQGVYDPNQLNTRNRTFMVWDGRDASGKQVASGYYFMVMTMKDPASDYSSSKATCIFYLNDADRDKLK